MAEIFQLFPAKRLEKDKSDLIPDQDDGVDKIKRKERDSDGYQDEFPVSDSRDIFLAKQFSDLHGISLTVMTQEQFVRFRMLKQKLMGLQGKYGKNAYAFHYGYLKEQEFSDLLPILEGMGDEEFFSRPAYTWALIKVLEEKDLILARKSIIHDKPNK